MVTRIRAFRRGCLKEHTRDPASRRLKFRWVCRSCHSFVIVPNVLTGHGLRRATTPAKLDPHAKRPVLGLTGCEEWCRLEGGDHNGSRL